MTAGPACGILAEPFFTMKLAHRTDVRDFGEPYELAGGGLGIPATLARPGVQIYYEGGKQVREYRPPEEVFAEQSLASYRAAPVTLGHPSEFVTPATWDKLAVGGVMRLNEKPHREDGVDWVTGELSVQRADALAEVQGRRRKGISVGYQIEVEETPGVTPEGEQYDRVQKNIRVNHVALLLEGEAPRAGNGARLRTDNQTQDRDMKITINGIEYDRGSDAHLSALEAEVAKAEQRADQTGNDLKAAQARVSQLEAERDAEKQRADKAEQERNDSTSEAAIEAAAEELSAFRQDMRRVLGADYDFQGKSRHAVRLDALEKMNAKPSDDSEQAVAIYLQARLDALPAEHDYNLTASEPKPRQDSAQDVEAILAAKRLEAAKAGGLI